MKEEILEALARNHDLGEKVSRLIEEAGITVFDSAVLLTAITVISTRSANCRMEETKTIMSATMAVLNEIVDVMHQGETHGGHAEN